MQQDASRALLTIGYSSLASRVNDIVLPAPKQDVEILIIVQDPTGTAQFVAPSRSDVRTVQLDSKGVAKSRNVAITQAKGKYLVFADDDIEFKVEGLDAVLAHFAACDCALVLGQAVDEQDVLRKNYPTQIEKLNLFNSARAATYEMVIDVDKVRESNVTFDENFGAGVTNYLGDEFIFIADLLRSKRSAHFLPVTLAVHPTDSSGSGWGSQRDLKVRAEIFTRVFGWYAPAVRLLFIAKHFNKVNGLRNALSFVLRRFK